jgi:hypothetical protein
LPLECPTRYNNARVILEKLVAVQLIKKFSALYAVLEVGQDGIPFLFEKSRNHPSAF